MNYFEKEEAWFKAGIGTILIIAMFTIAGCNFSWFNNRSTIDMVNITSAMANMPKVMEILKSHEHSPETQAAIDKADADFEDIKQSLMDNGSIVTTDFLFSIYDVVKTDYDAVKAGILDDMKGYPLSEQLVLQNFHAGMLVIDKSLLDLKAEANNPELKAQEEKAIADRILTLLSLVVKIVPAFL